MDLAMPGIDGWDTIRRLQREFRIESRVAIVSANAFDKSLENDVGIRAEDFITKPVRHSELLDWLERQWGLRWVASDVPAPRVDADMPWHWPGPDDVTALREAAQLGYYRGIMNRLDAIDAAQPQCASFVQAMRELARQFRFEAIVEAMKEETS
jgi:CheY-like chemotaxis protein